MPFRPTTDPIALDEIAQFEAPRIAVDAINPARIVREAAEDGVERPHIEMNTLGASTGRVRLSCRAEMALRLLCAWVELAGNTPTGERSTELLAEVRLAATAAWAGYEQAINPRRFGASES